MPRVQDERLPITALFHQNIMKFVYRRAIFQHLTHQDGVFCRLFHVQRGFTEHPQHLHLCDFLLGGRAQYAEHLPDQRVFPEMEYWFCAPLCQAAHHKHGVGIAFKAWHRAAKDDVVIQSRYVCPVGGFSFGVPGNLPFVISQGESSAGVSIRFALCDIFAHSIHLRFDDLRAADPFFLL